MADQDPSLHLPIALEELGLKYMKEQELLESLFQAGESWTDEEKTMVAAAYDLARVLHKDDQHRNLPYTYHLLRNANRVARYLHITGAEIITAVILHDGVEDHANDIIRMANSVDIEPTEAPIIPDDPYLQQDLALEHLAALFTPRVASMVAAVTNQPEVADITYEEKLLIYTEKVRTAVTTLEGWIVKFVDWVDNALGIIHNNEPLDSPQMQHYARKYQMVALIFEERYRQPDIQALLDSSAREYVEHQFGLAKERLVVVNSPIK